MVAPIALYPDALLAQVLVASTYPLEIVKAERWVSENGELEGDARTDAADAEGWDPSVAVLAAGFPTVVERMGQNLDQTEALGDALLAQSDDVLEAIQRMRARADAVGNLESNEAQEVVVENGSISIEPADPEVIYVPSYDSTTVYSSAAPPESSSLSATDMIVTGAVIFGTALLIDELFDDDDDWDDYWHRHHHFDWDDDDFYPRPGWGGGNFSGNDIDIDIGEVNIDRDRLDIDRDGAWKPDSNRRDEARDKLAKRKDHDGRLKRDGGAATLPARDAQRDQLKSKLGARSGESRLPARADGQEKLARKATPTAGAFKERDGSLGSTTKAKERAKASTAKKVNRSKATGAAKPKISRPSGGGKVAQTRKPKKQSAFHKGGGNKAHGGHAKKAKARGKRSAGKKRRRQ